MAPSEIVRKGDSLSLSNTSPAASSAPLSVLPTSKAQGKKEGGDDTGVNKDTPMADSPGHNDHRWFHTQNNSHEMGQPETRHSSIPRQPRISSRTKYSSQEETYNSTSSKPYPEVRYAKADILPPEGETMPHVLPGETLYLSQNRPSGYPGYTGDNGNNGGNNGYPNGGGYYGGPNGGASPHPNPFQKGAPGNAGGYPHYPYTYMHYPQTTLYYDSYGNLVGNTTTESGVTVRAEEVGIVLVVLLLWVGAIILFFNRWGKIRMLEPYQPKFCEEHRPSCPMADIGPISAIPPYRERTFSKYNLSTEMLAPNGSPHFVKCNYHGIPTSSGDPAPGFSGMTSGMRLSIPGEGFMGGGSTGVLNTHRNSIMYQQQEHQRPRQNSVFVTSPSLQVNTFYGIDNTMTLKSSSRRTKSAVDLPTLVLSGEFIDNVKRNSKNSITQL